MPTSVNLPPGHKPSTHADEIVCEDPEQYHQYGRTLHKLEDIALRKKHRTWMIRVTGCGALLVWASHIGRLRVIILKRIMCGRTITTGRTGTRDRRL